MLLVLYFKFHEDTVVLHISLVWKITEKITVSAWTILHYVPSIFNRTIFGTKSNHFEYWI